MNLTLRQAQRILEVAPPGSPYWLEARKVLEASHKFNNPYPVIAQDSTPPIPQDDDDGYPD